MNRTDSVNAILEGLKDYHEIEEGKKPYKKCIFGKYYLWNGSAWEETTKENYISMKSIHKRDKKTAKMDKKMGNAKKAGDISIYPNTNSKIMNLRNYKSRKK